MAEALLSVVRMILRVTKHTHYKAMHPKYLIKKKHLQLAQKGRVYSAYPIMGSEDPFSSLYMLPTLSYVCFKSIIMGRKLKLEISV